MNPNFFGSSNWEFSVSLLYIFNTVKPKNDLETRITKSRNEPVKNEIPASVRIQSKILETKNRENQGKAYQLPDIYLGEAKTLTNALTSESKTIGFLVSFVFFTSLYIPIFFHSLDSY